MSLLAETLEAAIRHQRAGQLREAERLLLEVVRADPHQAEALNRLGAIAGTRGDPHTAIGYFARALARCPDEPQFHRNIATAFKAVGKLEQALFHYRQALRLDPHSALAHANLAEALMELGQLDPAVAHNRMALQLDPKSALAAYQLAELACQGHAALTDSEICRLEQLAASVDASPADASLAHFGLAMIQDRAGSWDQAFAHYRQGNDLKREVYRLHGQGFDPDRYRSLADAMIHYFAPDTFQRLRQVGSESEVPLFVVGMVRSGTTLVEQILASHPQVRGAGELDDIERIAQALPGRLRSPERFPRCLDALDAPAAGCFAQAYLQRLADKAGTASRLVDKMPHNYMYLGLIATLFPRARIIHCCRDPLDLAASIYFQNFKWLPYATRFEDIAFVYEQYRRLMAHWQKCLPLPILDVPYEELLADQETTTRRLIAFCGLSWDSRCLAFHQTQRSVQTASRLQVRRPLHRGSLGRWKPYETYLRPLLDAMRRLSHFENAPVYTDQG